MDQPTRPDRDRAPALDPYQGRDAQAADASTVKSSPAVTSASPVPTPVTSQHVAAAPITSRAVPVALAADDVDAGSNVGRVDRISSQMELPKAGAVLDVGARSDIGLKRENNEDSFALAPELNLFVVSDGMGGQASGEVASHLVTKTILERLRGMHTPGTGGIEAIGEPIAGASETSNRLANAIRIANREVRRAAEQNLAWRGMGATVVAVQIDDGRVSVAHVGDSRVYRIRGGQIEQITQDHSFVAEQVRQGMMTQQEAETSKLQNVLLRALGVDGRVEVEVDEELGLEGDTLLLCSDGLTRELTDSQIAAVVEESATAQRAADRLVSFANQAGGGDNITVIVIRYGPRPGGTFAKLGRWLKGSK